jgi:hypothetical protein
MNLSITSHDILLRAWCDGARQTHASSLPLRERKKRVEETIPLLALLADEHEVLQDVGEDVVGGRALDLVGELGEELDLVGAPELRNMTP